MRDGIDVGRSSSAARAQPVVNAAQTTPDPSTLAELEQLRAGGLAALTAALLAADVVDPEAERLAAEEYYAEAVRAANPDARYDALHALLSDTHSRRLGYTEARLRYLYPVVDRHEDGMLRSIYSGAAMDPEKAINEDAATDAVLLERVSGALDGTDDAAAGPTALADLELGVTYNCEHVVPQSWFGKANPIKGDLHHLFACEVRCNNYRGNTPYFDFPGNTGGMESCGRKDGNRFEPRQGKGAVARDAVLPAALPGSGERQAPGTRACTARHAAPVARR